MNECISTTSAYILCHTLSTLKDTTEVGGNSVYTLIICFTYLEQSENSKILHRFQYYFSNGAYGTCSSCWEMRQMFAGFSRWEKHFKLSISQTKLIIFPLKVNLFWSSHFLLLRCGTYRARKHPYHHIQLTPVSSPSPQVSTVFQWPLQ